MAKRTATNRSVALARESSVIDKGAIHGNPTRLRFEKGRRMFTASRGKVLEDRSGQARRGHVNQVVCDKVDQEWRSDNGVETSVSVYAAPKRKLWRGELDTISA